jgi:DNA polymerase-3 subunit beta
MGNFSHIAHIGRAQDTLNINLKGNDFTIGFNSRYLIEALKATESEEVYIRFNGSTGAAVITPVEGDDYIYLVLPMILK